MYKMVSCYMLQYGIVPETVTNSNNNWTTRMAYFGRKVSTYKFKKTILQVLEGCRTS